MLCAPARGQSRRQHCVCSLWAQGGADGACWMPADPHRRGRRGKVQRRVRRRGERTSGFQETPKGAERQCRRVCRGVQRRIFAFSELISGRQERVDQKLAKQDCFCSGLHERVCRCRFHSFSNIISGGDSPQTAHRRQRFRKCCCILLQSLISYCTHCLLGFKRTSTKRYICEIKW